MWPHETVVQASFLAVSQSTTKERLGKKKKILWWNMKIWQADACRGTEMWSRLAISAVLTLPLIPAPPSSIHCSRRELVAAATSSAKSAAWETQMLCEILLSPSLLGRGARWGGQQIGKKKTTKTKKKREASAGSLSAEAAKVLSPRQTRTRQISCLPKSNGEKGCGVHTLVGAWAKHNSEDVYTCARDTPATDRAVNPVSLYF